MSGPEHWMRIWGGSQIQWPCPSYQVLRIQSDCTAWSFHPHHLQTIYKWKMLSHFYFTISKIKVLKKLNCRPTGYKQCSYKSGDLHQQFQEWWRYLKRILGEKVWEEDSQPRNSSVYDIKTISKKVYKCHCQDTINKMYATFNLFSYNITYNGLYK